MTQTYYHQVMRIQLITHSNCSSYSCVVHKYIYSNLLSVDSGFGEERDRGELLRTYLVQLCILYCILCTCLSLSFRQETCTV